MSETCKVIYFGELQPGFEAEEIIEAFSKRFKVSREKTEKLLGTSKEVVLKGGLDSARAMKYKKLLERIGLVVRIDSDESDLDASTLSLESTEIIDDEKTQVMVSTPMSTEIEKCPKCDSPNMQQGICRDCGVVAEKYLASHSRGAGETAGGEGKATTKNPYSAPEADLLEPQEGEMNGPTGVPAGHGWAWLAGGWWYFKQNPVAWVLAILTWILLAMGVGMIPLLGGLVVNLATPIITAGFMIGCQAQHEGEDFTLGHLFAGFSNNPGQLLLLGVIYFGAMILLVIGMMIGLFGMLDMEAMQSQNPEMVMGAVMSPGFIIAMLVGFLLLIPLMMAYFFAPALVALDDMKALEAMKLSFSGCLKNLLPLTVYGLLATLLMILGSIPLGLGLLIVLPLLTASMYAAYRDIYYS
ncbi:MAG: BPSS1780 family membrane protein [Pseudomonadota bacterium]